MKVEDCLECVGKGITGSYSPIPCRGCNGKGKVLREQESTDFRGGVALRDYFAAKALQGLLAFGSGPVAHWICDSAEGGNLPVAEKAYEIADSMLAARSA